MPIAIPGAAMNAADFPRMGLAASIERLESMPGFLAAALDAADPADLLYTPAPGELSLTEQACHLRDLEREGYLVRVRRMLTEVRPDLEGFDGAAVAASRDYASQDAKRAAQDFAAARRELTALLQPLTAADMKREATFEGKPVCFGDLVSMMVDHDRGHREEIERLMDDVEE